MFVETGYHQKTETADPFKLETLIGWLETKNPNQPYAYLDQGNCCLAQYFKEKTTEFTRTYSAYARSSEGKLRDLPYGFNACAKGPYDNSVLIPLAKKDRKSLMPEWTFGKALQRAKQYAKV